MFRKAFKALACAVALTAAAGAQAQSAWKPDGPVKLVAPTAPGTAADTVARFFAEALGREWGSPVVVDNRVGANGILGSDTVAKSKPDGRTLLVVSSPHYINKSIYAKLPFDPIKDFTPIAGFSTACQVLVVAEDAPYKTLQDLIDAMRAKPDALSYSSSGSGSVTHLAAAVMLADAKVKANHVPYKGGDTALTDVVSRQVDFMFAPLTSAVPLVEAKRLRALAVSAKQRVPSLPGTPTVAEAGLPGYEVVTRFGFLAAGGTPQPQVEGLSAAILKIAASPAFRAFALPRGFVPDLADSKAYAASRPAELEKWAKVVSISGAKKD